MDYIPSNILQFDQASQHADDLFQVSTFSYIESTIQDNQALPPTPSQDGRDLTWRPSSGRRKRKASSSSISFSEIDDKKPKGNKKVMQRDIERQRRQEMGTLYASLRSQLPLEYLKGKRSISDHVYQAGNYIKHLQNNIEELHNKRDQLKRTCNILCSASTENTQCKMQDSVIIVRPCRAGMEVVVNTPLKQGLPLSRVLEILVGEGLSTVSCISTEVNERSIYTTESEVCDGSIIDMSELQQRLTRSFDQAWLQLRCWKI